jgi:hypothetical protein
VHVRIAQHALGVAMLRTVLTAAVSLSVSGLVAAAETSTVKIGSEAPATSIVGAELRPVITATGSGSVNVAGSSVTQSEMRAPVMLPVTPFTYAHSGDVAHDAEVRRQLQDIQEREQRLLQIPEYRDLLRARQRLSLTQTHRDLTTIVQIPKEQADQLLDLLAEQRVREQLANPSMVMRPLDQSELEARLAQEEERRKTNEAELLALLGPAKYQDWKDYEKSDHARFMVQQLQSAVPNEQLRPDQYGALVRTIARERRKIHEDGSLRLPQGDISNEEVRRRFHEQHVERMMAAHRQILDASSTLLSPRQLEQLSAILERELELLKNRRDAFQGMPLVQPSLLPPMR